MTKRNEINWEEIEGLATTYGATVDIYVRESILGDIMGKVEKYLNTCVNNAHSHANATGLHIPKEDFESYMTEYVWKAIESFDKDGGYKIGAIIKRRIHLAEIDVSRTYRKRGSDSDKDGYTYESARWDSLNRSVGGEGDSKELANYVLGDTPSAEDEYFDNAEQLSILEDFEKSSKKNIRYANIIRNMWLGFEGDDLARITGVEEAYNAKMRTYVSRAKTSFKEFMESRVDA